MSNPGTYKICREQKQPHTHPYELRPYICQLMFCDSLQNGGMILCSLFDFDRQVYNIH